MDGGPGPVEIIVVPDVELKDLSYSLDKFDASGRESAVFTDRKLGRNYYPAGGLIAITLPQLEPKKTHRVGIAPTFAEGGSRAFDVYLVNLR
jgi:hypothetical protein